MAEDQFIVKKLQSIGLEPHLVYNPVGVCERSKMWIDKKSGSIWGDMDLETRVAHYLINTEAKATNHLSDKWNERLDVNVLSCNLNCDDVTKKLGDFDFRAKCLDRAQKIMDEFENTFMKKHADDNLYIDCLFENENLKGAEDIKETPGEALSTQPPALKMENEDKLPFTPFPSDDEPDDESDSDSLSSLISYNDDTYDEDDDTYDEYDDIYDQDDDTGSTSVSSFEFNENKI